VVITGAPRKRLACQKRARGFESHPLRQAISLVCKWLARLSAAVRNYDDVLLMGLGDAFLISLASGELVSDAKKKPVHRNLV
jgi:hypothetical protein